MPKIIFLKGLPGSGKSTWRKQFIRENPMWLYTNKDEIRAEIRIKHGMNPDAWNKKLETEVEDFEFRQVINSLEMGYNIIIDNTHLDPRLENKYRKLAENHNYDFQVKFFDVSLEECLRRNALREGIAWVPDKVIIDMYNKWLKPEIQKPEYLFDAPMAIIVDMDGTLALFGKNNPYDRDFSKDEVNWPVWTNLHYMSEAGYRILITSGRNGKFRKVTEEWLLTKRVNYDILLMRDEHDNRKDSEVKRDFYNNHIKGKYNILYVLDDRNQVVELWRSLGLTVFQVAEGNF